jgi:hypothetical protein
MGTPVVGQALRIDNSLPNTLKLTLCWRRGPDWVTARR